MSFNIAQIDGKIQGVEFKKYRVFPDSRGSFSEVFRSEWPGSASYGRELQLNLSRSVKGAVRGLHFHHRQSDWWITVTGILQVALADLREGSPTFMKTLSFTIRTEDNVCILVPPGVAHGFLAIEDVSLIYAVNRFYDGSDEQGVAWNDSELNIAWAVSCPVLSERDISNPSVEDLRKSGSLPFFKNKW